MELLTDRDISNIAKALKIPLRHIGFKDTFQKIKPVNGAYVINLQSKQGNTGGSHWTGLIIKNGHVVYFDPFGLPVPILIRQFVARCKPKRFIYSQNDIQSLQSVLCGYFVLYFLYFCLVKHKNCDRIGLLINKHNSIYQQEDRIDNDRIVQQLFRQLFQH